MNPNKYAYAGQPRSLEQSLRDEIADLRARCEKAEKDAGRYRWLRQQHESNLTKVHVRLDEFTITHRLDSPIDAAIAKEHQS